MNLNLTDKVVFIAGSSRGIGKAIAQAFADEGARVIISGRDAKNLVIAQKAMGGVEAVCCDLSKESGRQKASQYIKSRHKQFDALVLNIGNGNQKLSYNISAQDWMKALQENLLTNAETARVLLTLLKKGGSIVVVSSIVGLEVLAGAPLCYSTAKAALNGYAANLSKEVASFGIRVNVVSPGNIYFPGGRWEEKMKQRLKQVNAYIKSHVALQRFGKPEEVADLVVFLCSEKASFITGANYVIDGGQLSRIN